MATALALAIQGHRQWHPKDGSLDVEHALAIDQIALVAPPPNGYCGTGFLPARE